MKFCHVLYIIKWKEFSLCRETENMSKQTINQDNYRL